MHHWIRTKELVEAALDQPTDNRIAFVRATCGDESVCNDAIRLLNDLQTGSQFLQSRPGLIAGEFLASAAMPQFDAGDVLAGRFEIRRFLGRGGMGDVYEAADIQGRNTRVALKTIRSTLAGSNTLLSRLVDELIISRGVTHRNVCRVFDLHVHTPTTGVPAELLFVTMELLEGETLAERLVRCGPLSLDEGLVILYQLAAGLCAVHDAGVAHGDVKPGNVMLASQSGQTRTVLMDFGVAGAPRSPSPDQAGLAPAPGTPAYMAPEQAAGVITPASDIYSFGVLACEALTGTRPDAQSDRTRHIGPLRIGARAGMPEWLDSALRRCLRPDPPTRYQHARELLALFQRHGRFQDTGDFPVAPRSAETRGAERPASRRRMLVAGSVALLAAGVAWWVWSGAVSPQEP
ncbi:MAG TPA: serine/threonine-protein kinase, partial [Bryobacteraceae bacterium]|nr:serine/threonine-protein kinase [Bryobacteraceae bacterium]